MDYGVLAEDFLPLGHLFSLGFRRIPLSGAVHRVEVLSFYLEFSLFENGTEISVALRRLIWPPSKTARPLFFVPYSKAT